MLKSPSKSNVTFKNIMKAVPSKHIRRAIGQSILDFFFFFNASFLPLEAFKKRCWSCFCSTMFKCGVCRVLETIMQTLTCNWELINHDHPSPASSCDRKKTKGTSLDYIGECSISKKLQALHFLMLKLYMFKLFLTICFLSTRMFSVHIWSCDICLSIKCINVDVAQSWNWVNTRASSQTVPSQTFITYSLDGRLYTV